MSSVFDLSMVVELFGSRLMVEKNPGLAAVRSQSRYDR